ncbi:peptide chain release factor 1 [Candidatus Dojkabacteria bacterium]|nr:peptide chain release factor 1 [Candidatus Dojkabacteria bacterium]
MQLLQKNYNIEKTRSEKERLEKQLMDPSKIHESERSRLYSELEYFTDYYKKILNLDKKIDQYKESTELSKGEDQELAQMAQDELQKLEKEIGELREDIKQLEIEKKVQDPDDDKPAILEIRAGAGGDEAGLFAANLFRMYSQYASSQGWTVELIDSNTNEAGGFKEVIAKIDGKKAYQKLKYESGVHRVQRVPVTESSGRIHTSTASVAILPEASEIDIEIKPEDLKIEVMRASGAGGQCVNKTDSAVRMTHLPSGIVVSCQETKHQAQNKEKALAIMRTRLYEKKREEEAAKRDDLRSSQIGTMMRAEKIRTYNFPQNRITDHRIKKSWHNLEEVLDGALDEIVKAVREAYIREIIDASNE